MTNRRKGLIFLLDVPITKRQALSLIFEIKANYVGIIIWSLRICHALAVAWVSHYLLAFMIMEGSAFGY